MKIGFSDNFEEGIFLCVMVCGWILILFFFCVICGVCWCYKGIKMGVIFNIKLEVKFVVEVMWFILLEFIFVFVV